MTLNTTLTMTDEIIAIIYKYPKEWEKFKGEGVLEPSELFEELYMYFVNCGEMPYGVAKARTGDPYEWISDKVVELLL